MRRLVLSFVLVLMFAGHAFAQEQWTPGRRVAFDHSDADYNNTTFYEFGYFTSMEATTPVAVVQIPRDQFTSEAPEVRHAPLPRPTTGTFYIRALAGNEGARSGWSLTAVGPMIFGPDTAPPPGIPTGIRILIP